MEPLELFKKDWKRIKKTLPKYPKKELYGFIYKKSTLTVDLTHPFKV
ncbi:hypothetical protein FIA58_006335 [Flavobacterium jejuense]|uniref:Uncharacterized protein n=1 Tax=Flavobacterium jejuense TaxID=1544455 RepID=A0ABX0IQ20_9FLAO|nr:hypothetical protein [Flavobacterium jejuense]NHN25291.1 hypothetical protein [Flavobacterium jejuense]